MPLQGINHVHGGDRLPPGVLGVGHSVANHILQEDLEDAPSLLVDEAADTLHTTSASQTANRGLGDALDVVPENLPVTLGTSFAQALASLSTARHFSEEKEEKKTCSRAAMLAKTLKLDSKRRGV